MEVCTVSVGPNKDVEKSTPTGLPVDPPPDFFTDWQQEKASPESELSIHHF